MESVNYFYGGGASPHYSIDNLLANGSSLLYSSDDDLGRMFLFDNETYKAISSSIVFGALKNSDNLSLKPYLMAEIINYFLGISPVTGITDLLNPLQKPEVSNYPNPFSESTSITFTLTKDAFVEIEVYNALGKNISNLGGENLPAGNHSIQWNASSDNGRQLEPGFYFYTVKIDNKQYSGKMIYNR